MTNRIEASQTLIRLIRVFLIAPCALVGCTVASVGTERTGWHPSQSRITSCEEGCATWSDDGERCIRLRDESLRHCTTEQLRSIRR